MPSRNPLSKTLQGVSEQESCGPVSLDVRTTLPGWCFSLRTPPVLGQQTLQTLSFTTNQPVAPAVRSTRRTCIKPQLRRAPARRGARRGVCAIAGEGLHGRLLHAAHPRQGQRHRPRIVGGGHMQARTSPASVSVKLSSRACAREAALLSSCRSSRPPNSDIAPPGRRPLRPSRPCLWTNSELGNRPRMQRALRWATCARGPLTVTVVICVLVPPLARSLASVEVQRDRLHRAAVGLGRAGLTA